LDEGAHAGSLGEHRATHVKRSTNMLPAVDERAEIQIERPRGVFEILEATFALYQRFPALWFVLAAGVVVPYQVIVLLVTGAGPFAQSHVGAGASLVLEITDGLLVGPLISALHVHGVRDVRDGNRPLVRDVARRSIVVLPVVSAAVIISLLGVIAGTIALIVPGFLLWMRWSVAAQVAALEKGGWTDALRHSAEITRGHYWHIFQVILLCLLIGGVPFFAAGAAFSHTHTNAASFLVGTALRVLTNSFVALAIAILYFDLKARFSNKGSPAPAADARSRSTLDELPPPTVPGVEPNGHPLDPMSWSDEDRPAGWYVDLDSPWKMRYWSPDGEGGWSKQTAKTPKQTLAEWRDPRWKREKGD
jgi:hypothetical protein